jgi:hypothetical protein
MIAELYDTTNGSISRVFQGVVGYYVKFFDSNGKHMDASDYHATEFEDAMNEAGIEHPSIVRRV